MGIKILGWISYIVVITVIYMFLGELLMNLDNRYDWGIEWGYGAFGVVLLAAVLLWRKTKKLIFMGMVVAALIGLILLAGESSVGISSMLQDLTE